MSDVNNAVAELEKLKAKAQRAEGAEITIQTYPGIGLVEIHYRGRLEIVKREVFLTFPVVKMLFFQVLQSELNAQTQGGAPAPASSPVPGKPS